MRIKKLLPHAKQRLFDRFGLTQLPEGKREFVKSTSNNRKVYHIGEVYFVLRKSDHKIISVLTKEMVGKFQ